jgi:isoquinoline 1-oxidoreductase alpha subunit
MPPYTLMVNGAHRQVEGPADMPLFWVLRDLLGLTGTKFGGDIGACWAYTVPLDGAAVPSCRIPVSAALHGEIPIGG